MREREKHPAVLCLTLHTAGREKPSHHKSALVVVGHRVGLSAEVLPSELESRHS